MDFNTKELESKAMAIPEQAKAIIVADNTSMERANRFKVTIKAMIKEVDEFFKPLEKLAFDAHRGLTTKHKEINKPLEDADQSITNQVKAYLRKVEEARQAEEARLREEARKQEEERRLQEAIELEKQGFKEEAQQIIEEPVTFVAPTVTIETPKVDMRGYRTVWKWKVTNMAAIPREYLCVDESKVNGIVRAMKSATAIPGIQVYEE